MIRKFWLTAMFTIAGLVWFNSYSLACFNPTDSFIEEISQKAKAGISGWNSRLVYEDGRWLPYYETDAPLLLRDKGGGCGGFNVDNMPEGQLLLPNPSNVTPKDRLIITWGYIKVNK